MSVDPTQLRRIEIDALTILAILKAEAGKDDANWAELKGKLEMGLASIVSRLDMVLSALSLVNGKLDTIQTAVNGEGPPEIGDFNPQSATPME